MNAIKALGWDFRGAGDFMDRTLLIVEVPAVGKCVYRVIGPTFGVDEFATIYEGYRIA